MLTLNPRPPPPHTHTPFLIVCGGEMLFFLLTRRVFYRGGFGAAAEGLQGPKRPTLRGGEGAEATAAGGSGRQQGTMPRRQPWTGRRPHPTAPLLFSAAPPDDHHQAEGGGRRGRRSTLPCPRTRRPGQTAGESPGAGEKPPSGADPRGRIRGWFRHGCVSRRRTSSWSTA